MNLSDLNYCILNENNNRMQREREIMRLAWYSAYFNRVEKLEPLKYYFDLVENKNEPTHVAISPKEAENIYNKLRKKSGGI